MKLLEIIIAIILVYAIFSMIVSTLLEWWSSRRKSRGILLNDALNRMLGKVPCEHYNKHMYNPSKRSVKDSCSEMEEDGKYLKLLKRHPMISAAQNRGVSRPAQYIDPDVFANALIDVISWEGQAKLNMESEGSVSKGQEGSEPVASDPKKISAIDLFYSGVESIDEDHESLRKMFEQMFLKADGELPKLKEQIKLWYDTQMDRVSGWYKRRQARLAIYFGLGVALLFNVDTIHLFRVISLDGDLQSSLVASADEMTKKIEDGGVIDSTKSQLALVQKSVKVISADGSISQDQFDELKASVEALKILAEEHDEQSAIYIGQLGQIVNEANKLGIPVGWSLNTFPLSILSKSFTNDSIVEKDENEVNIKVKPISSLGEYYAKRNAPSNNKATINNFIIWLAGILISGFALSRGSGFWFEMMVKFVNIRRAGIKPETKKVNKS